MSRTKKIYPGGAPPKNSWTQGIREYCTICANRSCYSPERVKGSKALNKIKGTHKLKKYSVLSDDDDC